MAASSLLAIWLCEACDFYLTSTLKLGLTLFCWWLAVQEQLVCDLVRGDVMVLFCHRRITGQLLDRGSGFLAADVTLVFLMRSPQVLRCS